MAKVFLGGGLFLVESAISGYSLLGKSPDAIAGALLLTFLGAAPLACHVARTLFSGEAAETAEPAA